MNRSEKRTLRGFLVDKGVSMKELADYLKIARSTLYRKIATNSLSQKEIVALCEYLNVEDPALKDSLFLQRTS